MQKIEDNEAWEMLSEHLDNNEIKSWHGFWKILAILDEEYMREKAKELWGIFQGRGDGHAENAEGAD